ncbi:uncharacterized protein LOC130641049 [Hydractinia symbiolongicarpus]|uniref:uncharacterized protein LOC130641049 n=1 Tax=Hydractinia symbiolongicarpus TaxID=13093 RepID=UPI00254D43D0|nr:uncharacterized protein LOC130641049 [Hydractinia symbiolongicarpus]
MKLFLLLYLFGATVVKIDSKGGGDTTGTASSSGITVSINGTVTRERDVFLKCTFDIVARSIFWERNGKMVALKIKDVDGVDISNEKFIGMQTSPYTYYLKIVYFRESDAGTYRCSAASGSVTKFAELVVKADPISVDIKVQDNTRMECGEKSNNGYVSWFRDDILLFFNGTVFSEYGVDTTFFDTYHNAMLINVSVENSGFYTCRKAGYKVISYRITVTDPNAVVPPTDKPTLSGTAGYVFGFGLGVVILFSIFVIIIMQNRMTSTLLSFRQEKL